MSRKSKFDPVLKVKLVEEYLRDEIGLREATRLGVIVWAQLSTVFYRPLIWSFIQPSDWPDND